MARRDLRIITSRFHMDDPSVTPQITAEQAFFPSPGRR
jgi:hypothetical protein